SNNQFVNPIRRQRRDGLDLAIADTITFFGNQVCNQQHRPFIVATRPLRHLFEVGLGLLVLAKQPVDGSKRDQLLLDRLAPLWGPPFIEERIERPGSASVTIETACGDVVSPKWLTWNGATELAIVSGQVPIESRSTAGQQFGTHEPRQRPR